MLASTRIKKIYMHLLASAIISSAPLSPDLQSQNTMKFNDCLLVDKKRNETNHTILFGAANLII